MTVLLANICAAQTVASPSNNSPFDLSDEAFQMVHFSVMLSNNIISAGSTNILKCLLINNSTNKILYFSPALTVQLTNDSMNNYVLVEPPKPIFENHFLKQGVPAISLVPVEAGQTQEWSVPMVIKSDILLGTYQLIANQFVGKSVNGDAKLLTSCLYLKIQ